MVSIVTYILHLLKSIVHNMLNLKEFVKYKLRVRQARKRFTWTEDYAKNNSNSLKQAQLLFHSHLVLTPIPFNLFFGWDKGCTNRTILFSTVSHHFFLQKKKKTTHNFNITIFWLYHSSPSVFKLLHLFFFILPHQRWIYILSPRHNWQQLSQLIDHLKNPHRPTLGPTQMNGCSVQTGHA